VEQYLVEITSSQNGADVMWKVSINTASTILGRLDNVKIAPKSNQEHNHNYYEK